MTQALVDALRKLRDAAQNIDDGVYFDKERLRASLVMLREGIERANAALARYGAHKAVRNSAASPPSGLREALKKIHTVALGSGDFYVWWGDEKRAESSRQYIVEICTAALTSTDDVIRCQVTGNPYGTDTLPAGTECDCDGCKKARAASL